MSTATLSRPPATRPRQFWDADDLLTRTTWRRRLPAVVGEEFRRFCHRHPRATSDLEGFTLPARDLWRLRTFATAARDNLLHGDGLVWIRGLEDLGLDPAEQRLFYLALGCALGEPMTEYGRMYEVRDRGRSYLREAIPVSQTSAPSGFHTDSSRLDCVPDFVGLLCEEPSVTGGRSLVSNALRAYHVLEREAPDALDVLQRPLVRDLVTPGVEKNLGAQIRNRFPVFARSRRPEGILFRYMRYWIERGQCNVGAPLGEREMEALDALDRVLSSEESVVRFRLERGDIVWINNRFVAHNRDGYSDTPDNIRRMQRMWIQY